MSSIKTIFTVKTVQISSIYLSLSSMVLLSKTCEVGNFEKTQNNNCQEEFYENN